MNARPEQFVATFDVLVSGSQIADDVRRGVREIRVNNYLRLPDMCTLIVTFPMAHSQSSQPIDDHPFDIGSKLEIKLGARDSLTRKTLFDGDIVTLEPRFGPGGAELVVRAFDPLHVLMRSRHRKAFPNVTTSDIVREIVSDAALTADVESTDDVHDFMQQSNETDWDYIWRLAERVGYEFLYEDGKACFRKPKAEASVELQWPTPLRSFNPRLTAVQQVSEVTLSAFDITQKQALNATADSSNQIASIGVKRGVIANAFNGGKIHVASEPVASQSEGKALAQALLDKLANGYIAAEGVTDGDPAIRAGTAIKVTGVGSKFSGTYRVAAATHLLRGGGVYETHFANSAAHTLLGVVGGDRGEGQTDFASQLVVGLVTNNNDPDGMGRVKVKYPVLGDTVESTWARIATPSAGNARGLLMLPVAGEEVLIGFEHDDPRRPYVLGSLFNGKDKPGDDLLAEKSGSFAVLSDHKILLQSKGEHVVNVGGKKTVEVQDDVQDTFKKDYKADVQGNWQANVTGQATLKATQPFEIDGQNVTIKGTTQIDIEGNVQVTIKAGSTSIQLGPAGVQISGPMIQLG